MVSISSCRIDAVYSPGDMRREACEGAMATGSCFCGTRLFPRRDLNASSGSASSEDACFDMLVLGVEAWSDRFFGSSSTSRLRLVLLEFHEGAQELQSVPFSSSVSVAVELSSTSESISSASSRYMPPLIGGVKLIQLPSIQTMRYLFIRANVLVELYL